MEKNHEKIFEEIAENKERKKNFNEDKKEDLKEKPEEISKKTIGKENRQLLMALIIIAIVIGGFVLTYYLIQESKKFEYQGLKWEKIKYQNLDIYHSAFPYYENQFNLWFRIDPRKNNISTNITFQDFRRKVIISSDYNSTKCNKAVLGTALLGQFFGAGKREVIGAINNKNPDLRGINPFANCSNSSESRSIIIIEMSETPEIVNDANFADCYHIKVGNCENVAATEKFVLAVLKQFNSKENSTTA